MKSVVGHDVSKDSFEVRRTDGKEKQFKNDLSGFKKLLSWAGPAELFVMEATGDYHLALADFLHERGRAVSVVNPQRASYYAKALGIKTKTDKVDARVLCLYAQCNEVPLYVPDTPAQRRLKKLVRHRQRMVDEAGVEKTILEEPAPDPFEARQCKDRLEFIKAQIKQVEREIQDVIASDEDLTHAFSLLQTIPGVGKVTALTILAEGGDLRRFKSAKAFAKFCGVHPRLRQSGTSVHCTSRMSKCGNAALRRCLYMSAVTAIRVEGPAKALFQRLRVRGMSKKAALGAVMHKQARLAFGVVRCDRPFSSERTGLTAA